MAYCLYEPCAYPLMLSSDVWLTYNTQHNVCLGIFSSSGSNEKEKHRHVYSADGLNISSHWSNLWMPDCRYTRAKGLPGPLALLQEAHEICLRASHITVQAVFSNACSLQLRWRTFLLPRDSRAGLSLCLLSPLCTGLLGTKFKVVCLKEFLFVCCETKSLTMYLWLPWNSMKTRLASIHIDLSASASKCWD